MENAACWRLPKNKTALFVNQEFPPCRREVHLRECGSEYKSFFRGFFFCSRLPSCTSFHHHTPLMIKSSDLVWFKSLLQFPFSSPTFFFLFFSYGACQHQNKVKAALMRARSLSVSGRFTWFPLHVQRVGILHGSSLAPFCGTWLTGWLGIICCLMSF